MWNFNLIKFDFIFLNIFIACFIQLSFDDLRCGRIEYTSLPNTIMYLKLLNPVLRLHRSF